MLEFLSNKLAALVWLAMFIFVGIMTYFVYGLGSLAAVLVGSFCILCAYSLDGETKEENSSKKNLEQGDVANE